MRNTLVSTSAYPTLVMELMDLRLVITNLNAIISSSRIGYKVYPIFGVPEEPAAKDLFTNNLGLL
jgi:hypothetical protein